jgi:serine/threonine-protein kinase
MIGQQIGNYRVVAKIGEGGMGAVYEAVDESIGKRVAIKVLHKDHAKNPQIALRFINEAKAINHVDHPGVVQVITSQSLPDGTAYIVMELLKGETLNARMKASGGRMPMLSALSLGRQLASALAAAHAKSIIHRDLKPDNVMLVPDSAMPGGERTKLLDFGIAKLKLEVQGGGDQVMTRAGVMMGTPLYMSPEQCRNASDVDDKADVYSLGVMLYRMLAGKPPFSAAGTGELMAMHIYMQPPPLSEADRSLPEPLVQLIHRMLAKKREERPSMSQVAQELERIAAKASSMVPAVPPGTPNSTGAAVPVQAVSVNESATVLSESRKTPPSLAKAAGPSPLLIGGVAALLLSAAGGFLIYRLVLRPASPPHTLSPQTQPKDNPANNPQTPAKPAPKPQAVNWHIESDPSGAQVYQIDPKLDSSDPLGVTPFRSSQPAKPGQVTLELRLKGYQAARLTVDGSKDCEPPTVKLDPEKSGRKRDRKSKGKVSLVP